MAATSPSTFPAICRRLAAAEYLAGLSQAELAARAGVAQSVISAYEAGCRQPALPTLARLIEAAGYDLVVDIRRKPSRLSRLSGPVGRKVRSKRRELVAAAAAHDVTMTGDGGLIVEGGSDHGGRRGNPQPPGHG
jgi:transcriptional regulator with XRE-family HTH domain